jgi:hypothetical protein
MITTMKKFLFAIGLLPLAACVVDPDDDDAGTGETEDSDSNVSNSGSMSTSTTTNGMTSAMTEPETTGETESGGSDSTGTPGGLGACETVCETFMDCCEAQGVMPENCMEEGMGAYVCESSECFVLGCADDMECQDFLMNEAAVCNMDSGACILGCETIEDCDMIAMDVYDLCDPDLGCTLTPEPFDCNDMGCTAPFVCDTESGACVECVEDGDCEGGDYGPYCNLDTNTCACMNDDDCAYELDVCSF